MQRKTDNKSVRFDKEQFDYICLKEKLSSPQSVVNFLLQDYWVKNKIVPTINQVQNEIAAHHEMKSTDTVTLNKIKDSCPKELKGLARTSWIYDERKKHGL